MEKKTYSAYKSNKTVHVKNWKKVKKAGRKKGKEGANKKLVIYKRRQFGNWGNKKKKKKKGFSKRELTADAAPRWGK